MVVANELPNKDNQSALLTQQLSQIAAGFGVSDVFKSIGEP
jgi:hypothetical protein